MTKVETTQSPTLQSGRILRPLQCFLGMDFPVVVRGPHGTLTRRQADHLLFRAPAHFLAKHIHNLLFQLTLLLLLIFQLCNQAKLAEHLSLHVSIIWDLAVLRIQVSLPTMVSKLYWFLFLKNGVPSTVIFFCPSNVCFKCDEGLHACI